jgi:hypothetical protein
MTFRKSKCPKCVALSSKCAHLVTSALIWLRARSLNVLRLVASALTWLRARSFGYECVAAICDDELTSILDIEKIGHRKKILLSLAGRVGMPNRFGKVQVLGINCLPNNI